MARAIACVRARGRGRWPTPARPPDRRQMRARPPSCGMSQVASPESTAGDYEEVAVPRAHTIGYALDAPDGHHALGELPLPRGGPLRRVRRSTIDALRTAIDPVARQP